jgi:tRNA pseudouridine55 synthase
LKISKSTNFAEGQILLLDKPLTWTSFQLVKKVRYLVKVKKVGHAGTLDPLATGLLIICTGKATKKIQGIQDAEKEYTGTFTLGATRPSYDKETEIDQKFDISGITEEQIHETASKFTGVIEQTPPIFSAIKVKGKRAYEHARKGEDIKLKPRNVIIREFEITDISLPEVSFRVTCSKGTYIRTLANDFGKALNNGAYLSSLRRTKIGDYSIENSLQIEEFESLLKEQ